MSKTLTKDCRSCNLILVAETGDFFCIWGKSKNKKKLVENRRAVKIRKQCTLKR